MRCRYPRPQTRIGNSHPGNVQRSKIHLLESTLTQILGGIGSVETDLVFWSSPRPRFHARAPGREDACSCRGSSLGGEVCVAKSPAIHGAGEDVSGFRAPLENPGCTRGRSSLIPETRQGDNTPMPWLFTGGRGRPPPRVSDSRTTSAWNQKKRPGSSSLTSSGRAAPPSRRPGARPPLS